MNMELQRFISFILASGSCSLIVGWHYGYMPGLIAFSGFNAVWAMCRSLIDDYKKV